MQRKRCFAIPSAAALVVIITLTFAGSASAREYKVLHFFTFNERFPRAGLVADAAGNLYGATDETVFRLAPNPDGSWTESTLYTFKDFEVDGAPVGALTLDAAGNLYGVTYRGGVDGGGTVFKLASNPNGSWTESVLYSFTGDNNPYGSLIFDAEGDLYGTTDLNRGSVFKLTPNLDGTWTCSVLHNFDGADGMYSSGLTFDAAGNLFGEALYGGGGHGHLCRGCGAAFRLTPNPDGSWTESTLYDFNGGDGKHPSGGLIFDATGTLYGTTDGGGVWNLGTVFTLTLQPDGSWSERVIHTFHGRPGKHPSGGLISDAAGNLYGTTKYGGGYNDGTIFKMTPSPDGTWKLTTLHIFKGTDGANPVGSLIFDAAGNLYGTTEQGGKGGGSTAG